jgi:hypothetical protein
MLGLTEILELLLLLDLCSLGSKGWSPDCLANRLSTSVRDTTPVSRPDIPAPGNADADTAGNEEDKPGEVGPALAEENRAGVAAGSAAGVGGEECDGEALSTTHILWLLVATSFATVCASVA